MYRIYRLWWYARQSGTLLPDIFLTNEFINIFTKVRTVWRQINNKQNLFVTSTVSSTYSNAILIFNVSLNLKRYLETTTYASRLHVVLVYNFRSPSRLKRARYAYNYEKSSQFSPWKMFLPQKYLGSMK